MEIFKKEKSIESLLSLLDIPRSEFLFDHKQGIGPYDPEFFEKNHACRQASEQRAEKALQAMTDEDLWELCETLGRLDSFALEYSLFEPPPWYAGGFGVCVYKPDYEYWAKMDFWTLEEAACLSLGFQPEKMPQYRDRKPFPYQALDFFRGRVSLIPRAPFSTKFDHDRVSPAAFVGWAENKLLEIPAELIQAVKADKEPHRPKMLNSVDKRQYDSALKVILGLLSSQFGYREGKVTPEMKSDIVSGLDELGLNLDRKTLIKTLNESQASRKRFEKEQKKRDEKDV